MPTSEASRSNIRCVLFDLDNTLVHRSRSIASYAELFLADFGERLESSSVAQVARLIEVQDNGGYLVNRKFSTIKDAVAATLVGNLQWKVLPSPAEVMSHWTSGFPVRTVEMDGAAALVGALAAQRIVIGIVSNGADKSRVDTVAQLSFRRHIAIVVSSERTGFRKPDSRLFAAAAAELGFAHDECVFVGDHPLNDIAGALAAGMSAIWLSGFHPWPTDMPETVPVASSLAEVGQHIAMWADGR